MQFAPARALFSIRGFIDEDTRSLITPKLLAGALLGMELVHNVDGSPSCYRTETADANGEYSNGIPDIAFLYLFAGTGIGLASESVQRGIALKRLKTFRKGILNLIKGKDWNGNNKTA